MISGVMEEKKTVRRRRKRKKQTGEKTNQPRDIIPSIEDQGYDVTFIDNEALCGAEGTPRFNGSICRYKGKLLIAYRYYDGKKNESQLAISELDDEFNVVSNHPLTFRAHGCTGSFMDPRLFVHDGSLWITFAEFEMGPMRKYRCIVRCVRFGAGYHFSHDLEIKFAHNYVNFEKNWMFYSHNGELWFYYSLMEQRCVRICQHTGRVLEEKKGGGFNWLMDLLRGGTPFIPYKDGFISFYHSGTNHPWNQRRYGLGSVVIEGKSPFKITRLSLPFMFGSREDEFIERSRPGNPNVVFVAGVIDDGDDFLVSGGINDSFNAVIRIPKSDVESKLEPIENFKGPRGKFYSIAGGRNVKTLMGMEPAGHVVRVSGMNGTTKYLNTDDPITIEWAANNPNIKEIEEEEYTTTMAAIKARMNFPPATIPEYLKKPKKHG